MTKRAAPPSDREARLQAALRANLRRRKQAPAPPPQPPLGDKPEQD